MAIAVFLNPSLGGAVSYQNTVMFGLVFIKWASVFMLKRIAILQSNYIPWKGYFDLINCVDEFVLYDDMQYTVDDWRNRNRIKTKQGVQWLTIPVSKKGHLSKKTSEIKVVDERWARKHWASLANAYAKSAYFKEYAECFEALYLHKASKLEYLSEVNYLFMSEIINTLGISTKIRWSSEFELGEGKTERLVNICTQAGADVYFSGPAARDYLDQEIFRREGINIEWMDYSNYPEYKQPHGDFEHAVSIIDLIFNTGSEAVRYLKSFGAQ